MSVFPLASDEQTQGIRSGQKKLRTSPEKMTDRRKAGLLVYHRLLDRTFPVAFVFGIAGHAFLDGLLCGVHRFLHRVSGFLYRGIHLGIHLVLMFLIIIQAGSSSGSQDDDNDDGPNPGAGGNVAFGRDRGVHPAGSIGRGIGAGFGTIGRPVPGDHALGADMFSAGGAAGHSGGVGMIQTIAFRDVSHKKPPVWIVGTSYND